MLRRTDARLVASIGFIFISVACLMVAYNLTPIWGSFQFLPSALLQAVGQSFALSGVIFFGILHLKPQDALTFGAMLQTARLMGGEIGTAFVTTLARVREQVASNLIGQHVQVGDADVIQRVRAYGAVTTRVIDPTGAVQRGQTGAGQHRAHRGNDTGGDGRLRRRRLLDGGVLADRGVPKRGSRGPRLPAAALSRARGEGMSARARGSRLLPAVLAGACLAACRVGPNYHAPALPPKAEAPLVSLNAAAETTATPPDAWWRLYDDPRLDQLVQEALKANLDLAAADANFAAARAALSAVHANRYPSTGIVAGGVYGRDPVTEEILELQGQRPRRSSGCSRMCFRRPTRSICSAECTGPSRRRMRTQTRWPPPATTCGSWSRRRPREPMRRCAHSARSSTSRTTRSMWCRTRRISPPTNTKRAATRNSMWSGRKPWWRRSSQVFRPSKANGAPRCSS